MKPPASYLLLSLLVLLGGGAVNCARQFHVCRHCDELLLLGLRAPTYTCGGNRVLTIHGGGTTQTSIYDPATNTYAVGPVLGGPVNSGALAFQIPNFGPRACQNVLIRGNISNAAQYYNPGTGQTSNITMSSAFDTGSHVIRYRSDASTRFLLIPGNTTNTIIYKPDLDLFTAGPDLMISTGGGSHSFELTTGPLAGKFIIPNGAGGANWRVFDPVTETISAHSTSALGPNSSSSAVRITSGAKNGHHFIALGGSNPNNMTYNPATNGFTTVGTVSATQNSGANTFMADAGALQGQIVIVTANGMVVDRYNPASDTVSNSGITTTAAVNAGGHNFLIGAGQESGNRMIVTANGTIVNVYRQASNSFVAVGGLQLTANAGTGSVSVPIAD
ncbi:MAG: hypothetical protein JNM27_21660 [Leptospirales bacterium]|nr:hypothetical protein [Leptospirales bacterium]